MGRKKRLGYEGGKRNWKMEIGKGGWDVRKAKEVGEGDVGRG